MARERGAGMVVFRYVFKVGGVVFQFSLQQKVIYYLNIELCSFFNFPFCRKEGTMFGLTSTTSSTRNNCFPGKRFSVSLKELINGKLISVGPIFTCSKKTLFFLDSDTY